MTRLKQFALFIIPLLFCFYFFDLGAPWNAQSKGKGRTKKVAEIKYATLQIESCNDGDTCKAKTADGFQITLRFLGIDTPEVAKTSGPKKKRNAGQAYGAQARDFTSKHVVGKKILAELRGSDAYNRYLTVLYPTLKKEEKSLNQMLIEEGYAFAYRGKMREFDMQERFVLLEAKAKKDRKGLWALEVPPADPAVFRRQTR